MDNQSNKVQRKSKFSNLSEQSVKSEKKYEIIDLKLSCDYIFQYINDNNATDRKYLNIQFTLCYFNQILLTSIILFSLLLMRTPSTIFDYSCYDVTSRSFIKCYYRSFCSCMNNCTVVCYDDEIACAKKFDENNFNIKDVNSIYNYREYYYVFFQSYGKRISIFDLNNFDYCYLYYLIPYSCGATLIGGMLGDIVLGLLSDRFGKRIIILISSVLFCIILILTSVILFLDISLNLSNLTFFIFVIIFPGGILMFPIRSLALTHFLEIYSNINYLNYINGILNSSLGISSFLTTILIRYPQNFRSVVYGFTFLMIIYSILFFFFSDENPRFYSEMEDLDNKKKALKKLFLKFIPKKQKGQDPEKDENTLRILKLLDTSNLPEKTKINKETNEEKKEKEENINKPALSPLEIDETHMRPQTNLSSSKTRRKQATVSSYSRKISILLKKKQNAIKTKDILNTFSFNSKQNFNHSGMIIIWLIISFIFNGTYLGYNVWINDKNKNSDITYFYLIVNLVFDIFVPYLVGSIAVYINPNSIIILSFLMISLIAFSSNWSNFSITNDNVRFFGSTLERININNNFNTIAANKIFATIIQTLFELLTLTNSPTLYRSFFYGLCRGISKISYMISYLSIFELECHFLYVGTASLLALLSFVLINFNKKDIKFEEVRDKPKKGMNLTEKFKNKLQNDKLYNTFKRISSMKYNY